MAIGRRKIDRNVAYIASLTIHQLTRATRDTHCTVRCFVPFVWRAVGMIISIVRFDLPPSSFAESHNAADYRDKEKECDKACNRYADYVPSHSLRTENIPLDPDVLIPSSCVLEFEGAQEAVISGSNDQCGSWARIYSYQLASSELVPQGQGEILSACTPKDSNHNILSILDEDLYFCPRLEGVFLDIELIVACLIVSEPWNCSEILNGVGWNSAPCRGRLELGIIDTATWWVARTSAKSHWNIITGN